MLYICCQILSKIAKKRDEKRILLSLFAPRISSAQSFPTAQSHPYALFSSHEEPSQAAARDYRITIHIPLNSPSRNWAMGIKIYPRIGVAMKMRKMIMLYRSSPA